MTKRRSSRQQPGPPVELVLLPDVPMQQSEVTQVRPSAYDHLAAMQRRVPLAGKRRYPGAPAGVRRVKIPSGFNGDGSVMWREM